MLPPSTSIFPLNGVITSKQERQNVVQNLLHVNNVIIEQQRIALEAFDLSLPQFNVLRILNINYPKPLSTAEIREKMAEKMSDTSRIVDRLIAKELAQKYPSRYDRRLVDVLITKKGKGLLEMIEKKKADATASLEALTDDEIGLLNDLCEKIRSCKSSSLFAAKQH
jgi:MarR family transcriptional regulator, 2-MHQ and catechol-resistance regulon repressor